MKKLIILAVFILSGCGKPSSFTITCDGPLYGQVAIMINDNNCPPQYTLRPMSSAVNY